MNTEYRKLLAVIAMFSLAGITSLQAKVQSESSSVMVDFQDPSHYTDIDMGLITTDEERQYLLDILRDEFRKNTVKYLPEGYSLAVTVKDVDLAGDLKLYAAASGYGVRILRDAFPPRLNFAYQIIDAEQNIIAESNARLSDINYLWTPRIRTNEHATYVSDLIRDWARADLRQQLEDN